MKKLVKTIIVLLTLISLVLSSASCTVKASPEKYQETRNMMDTFIQITIYSEDKAVAEKALNSAFARMEEIAGVASIYDEDSQAFQLNQNGYLDNPSLDLVRLIRLSIEYHKISDGYFDITVQPLLELWSGGLWRESEEEQQRMVNETLALVGSEKIDVTGDRIAFQSEGMKITLGAITKGYAVDEALKVLEDIGIKHALIAAAGDISSLGTKPNGEPWNIALVNPDNTEDSLATFTFAQKSVSTSGNYERYFSPDKKTHHIINPKTGFSAGDLISVTIITESGIQADALATSVFVMGPEVGMRLVESLDDVECFMVDNERSIRLSSGIDKYLNESG
jgi:thiamine biosynthesis lipoprotein